jgi:hypothetical protein
LDEQGLSIENATDDMVDDKLDSQEVTHAPEAAIGSIGSIWDTFLQFYPNYGHRTHADAKFDMLKETFMKANKESDLEFVHYPILALNVQASDESEAEAEEEDENEATATSTGRRPRSNSASNAVSDGLKKRKSSQIWIN